MLPRQTKSTDMDDVASVLSCGVAMVYHQPMLNLPIKFGRLCTTYVSDVTELS